MCMNDAAADDTSKYVVANKECVMVNRECENTKKTKEKEEEEEKRACAI